MVWIDVLAFDAAWRETDQWISPDGKTGAQDRRYRRIGEWIAAVRGINMGEIAIDKYGVSFTNGRHRFAWLRDRGARAMAVQVAPESAASFEARFGTQLRLSRFPTADRAVE